MASDRPSAPERADPFEHKTGAPCTDPWCADKADRRAQQIAAVRDVLIRWFLEHDDGTHATLAAELVDAVEAVPATIDEAELEQLKERFLEATRHPQQLIVLPAEEARIPADQVDAYAEAGPRAFREAAFGLIPYTLISSPAVGVGDARRARLADALWPAVERMVREAATQAEARGWAAAVEALRDDQRYRTWWRHTDGRLRISEQFRGHAADYLEAVAPKATGGDVTSTPTLAGETGAEADLSDVIRARIDGGA